MALLSSQLVFAWHKFIPTTMNYCGLLYSHLHVKFQEELCFEVIIANFTCPHEQMRRYTENSHSVCAEGQGRTPTYHSLVCRRHLTRREVSTERSRDISRDKNCCRKRQWPGCGPHIIILNASPQPLRCRSVTKLGYLYLHASLKETSPLVLVFAVRMSFSRLLLLVTTCF